MLLPLFATRVLAAKDLVSTTATQPLMTKVATSGLPHSVQPSRLLQQQHLLELQILHSLPPFPPLSLVMGMLPVKGATQPPGAVDHRAPLIGASNYSPQPNDIRTTLSPPTSAMGDLKFSQVQSSMAGSALIRARPLQVISPNITNYKETKLISQTVCRRAQICVMMDR